MNELAVRETAAVAVSDSTAELIRADCRKTRQKRIVGRWSTSKRG